MNAEEILSKMTLEEKAAFCSGRDFWHTKAVERLGVPSVMMCDGPHGLRKQNQEGDHLGVNDSIETVCYPTAAALASSFDRDVLQRLGEALGQECQAEEIAMLLGPGLNIKRSPLCGRNFEYFSEDPKLAGELGAAYVKALQGKGVAACCKHFACNNQETRRMSGSSEVDERTLREIYLPAFEAVVKKGGTQSIMCAYNAVNGTYCAENRMLLTDILRNEWGFDGFVVTDWGAVKDPAKGVAAGVDLEMPGGVHADGREIVAAVRDGTLSEEDLDRAVLRLLRFVLGAVERREPGAQIDRDACRALSRRLAEECAVLLKNDGLLPLRERQRVAFIGEFSERPRYQGAGSSHINVPHAVGALEAAGEGVVYARGFDTHSDRDDGALLQEAVEAAKNAEAAVIFAGLPDAYETEGADRAHMRLPENQNALIAAVAAVNPNTAVVLHGGAPMELPWLDAVSAVLCLYLAGEQAGAAAVDLLCGRAEPCGHLPETWPLRLEDNPSYLNFPGEDGIVTYAEGVFVGYRYYDKKRLAVRFPFGHGLSYTSFAYSNLRVDKERLTDREKLTVSVDVTNTGARPGKACVQLYVRDVESSVRRPVRELRDFARLWLQPGGTGTVRFTLDKRAFAYYEPKVHDFFVESGEFALELGESSRDLRVQKSVYVEGTAALPLHLTETSPILDLLRHPMGPMIVQQFMENAGTGALGDAENLGEGSDRMLENMIRELPLGALVSFDYVSREELDALLTLLRS
ncbi:MAG: glycoside hydrolase family 3 C-terminal domain-containing protein [Oscillospiraceae bacterium]|nr:glycoside hydrolase family 3 C-terminal domain-containing protein [Oscillospiraceae bacterium]